MKLHIAISAVIEKLYNFEHVQLDCNSLSSPRTTCKGKLSDKFYEHMRFRITEPSEIVDDLDFIWRVEYVSCPVCS